MSEGDNQQPNTNPPQRRSPIPGAAPPWPKGVSGNPKGRPRRLTMSELVEKILRTEKTKVLINDPVSGRQVSLTVSKAKAAAYVLSQRILAGDMRVIEYLGERRDPKRKPVDSQGDSGTPRIVRLPAGGPWGGQAAVRVPTEAAAVDPAPAPPAAPEDPPVTLPPANDPAATPTEPPAEPKPLPPSAPSVGD